MSATELAAALAFILGVLGLLVASFMNRSMQRRLRRLREVSARTVPRLLAEAAASSPLELEASPPTYVVPRVRGRGGAARAERAFHRVADIGVQRAVELAIVRHGTADTLGYVGRRNHRLVSQGLRLADQLPPTGLRPDQQAIVSALQSQLIGMQRDATRLLVIAGLPSMRGWDEDVSLSHVVEVATSDTQTHHRVAPQIVNEITMAPALGADVAHILAELIDNAATYSEEQLPVGVVGESLDAGYQIQVIDQGLGVESRKLAAMNDLLAKGEVDLRDSRRLGLSVVARLAFKNGIEVGLTEHDRTGLVARLLIPGAMVRPSSGGRVASPAVPKLYERTAPVESPVYESPVYESPVYESPVYESPVYEEPVYEEPLVDAPVIDAPAASAPVLEKLTSSPPPDSPGAASERPSERIEAPAERTEIRSRPWVDDGSARSSRRVRGSTLAKSPWDSTESAVDPRSDGPDMFGPALAALTSGRAGASEHSIGRHADDPASVPTK
ncbi:MAG: hypothetical protein ACRCYU_14015 [Nocardioides sp.]